MCEYVFFFQMASLSKMSKIVKIITMCDSYDLFYSYKLMKRAHIINKQ